MPSKNRRACLRVRSRVSSRSRLRPGASTGTAHRLSPGPVRATTRNGPAATPSMMNDLAGRGRVPVAVFLGEHQGGDGRPVDQLGSRSVAAATSAAARRAGIVSATVPKNGAYSSGTPSPSSSSWFASWLQKSRSNVRRIHQPPNLLKGDRELKNALTACRISSCSGSENQAHRVVSLVSSRNGTAFQQIDPTTHLTVHSFIRGARFHLRPPVFRTATASAREIEQPSGG